MHPSFPPLPPRPRVALGLAIVAVLAAYAEIRVRSHRSTGPGQPTAQTDRETAARASAGAGPSIVPGTLRLAGKVIDDRSRPIGDARVLLNGARATVSGRDGSFAFDGLAAGDYALIGEQGPAYGEHGISLGDGSGLTELALHVGPTLVVHVVHRIEVRSRADRRLYLASTLDGAFWFAQLPAGDYTASLGGEDGRPGTPFHVAAHRTTEISLR